MANETIKNYAKQNRVRLWEVAEGLGIQDSALSRKLRKELPPGEKEKILALIEKLARGGT